MKFHTCFLAGLVASALVASSARASLVINLRFADGSTTHQLTASDVGHDIEIDVWATITGNNPPSANNFYGLQYVYYSAVSSLPDGAGTAVNGAIDASANALSINFGGSNPVGFGAQTGVTQDINGDGVADVGSDTVLTDVCKPRSGNAVWGTGSNADFHPLPTGYDIRVEELFFHVTSLAGEETDFTPVPPPLSLTGPIVPANWFEDAPNTSTPSSGIQNGPYSGGTTVRLVAVPEPSCVALLIGAWGLVMGRRRGSLRD